MPEELKTHYRSCHLCEALCGVEIKTKEDDMQIRNLEFNVRVSGAGEPLIWGHGLLASMSSEDAMGLLDWPFFPKDRQLIRYDARGHGQTEPTASPADYHWENLAKDMLAVADQLHLREFMAGGQSMGCATSLYAGFLAPERITKLILMNPPTAWETRSEQGALYKKMAKTGGLLGGTILAKIISRKLERLLPAWLIAAEREKVSAVLEGLKPLRRKTLSSLFKGAALTDFPSRKEIKSIDIPTLILGWTDDPSHPLESAIELDKLMPQSTLVVAQNHVDLKKWPKLIRDFITT